MTFSAGGIPSTINTRLVNGGDGNGDNPLPTEPTTGALLVVDYATQAAIEGDVLCRWANSITPGAAPIVLVNATLVYNLNEGEIIMITQMCVEVLTLNDSCLFELGYTDQVNGGGTFTPTTPQRIVSTGAANQTFNGITFTIVPPGPISYANGARSITFRVNCNDANAQITPAWHAYRVTT